MATQQLKPYLDTLYRTYGRAYLPSDPLELVHRYDDPADQEVAGFVAAGLAFGSASQIRFNAERVLRVMGARPRRYIEGFDPVANARDFDHIVHRWLRGRDIACLVYFLSQMILAAGSIEAVFAPGYNPSRGNIGEALRLFVKEALALDALPFYGRRKLPNSARVRYFFVSPDAGSACKRLNLYLRWMVRAADDLDLGIWKSVSPAHLVLPIDTHIGRLVRYLGLTSRRSISWAMAVDATERLGELDPSDPVKYDFALCRLGILDRCPRKRDPLKCRDCLIQDVCTLR